MYIVGFGWVLVGSWKMVYFKCKDMICVSNEKRHSTEHVGNTSLVCK